MLDFIDDPAILDEPISELALEVSTIDAGDGESKDQLYANVVFADGTRLYEPFNRLVAPHVEIDPTPPIIVGTLPGAGDTRKYPLPLPPGLDRTIREITEFFIRKDGDDGWFSGGALLYANGHAVPVLGNRDANQFLDNDDTVLQLRDWSTASFCVAPASGAQHPLPRSGYRVLGPVIGQVSDTSAVVLYRVDREGTYRFRASDSVTGAQVVDLTADLEPTGKFNLTGLDPERRYDFSLSFVRADIESPVPDAAGSLHTYPPEGSLGRFAFAFGSCANPDKQVAQGCWTGIRSLAVAPPGKIEPVSLFIHVGDTFYFYDDVTEEAPKNKESMRAGHVSMRRSIEFLDMARVVPCCGIWDDHDFAGNNTDINSFSNSGLIGAARDTWLEYWGNQPISSELGLSTRITRGLVDIYLLDGRFVRDENAGVFFGKDLIDSLLAMIDQRGNLLPRVVVLATGSNWNHKSKGGENYGGDQYTHEREPLFRELAARMGETINGLLLLSGDDHINEIYHVKLPGGRIAPEIVSSPLTLNTDLHDDPQSLDGERVASFPSGGDNGKRGFTTVTLDTSNAIPDGNWTAVIRYYQEAAAIPYATRSYTMNNGEFRAS